MPGQHSFVFATQAMGALWRTAEPGQVIEIPPRFAALYAGAPPWVTVTVMPDDYVVEGKPAVAWLRSMWPGYKPDKPSKRAKRDTKVKWAWAQVYLKFVERSRNERPDMGGVWLRLIQLFNKQNTPHLDLSLDLETTGLIPYTCEIVGVSAAIGDGKQVLDYDYFPATPEILEYITFAVKGFRTVVGFNSRFDQAFFQAHGQDITFTDDAKIIAWIANVGTTLGLPTGGEEGRAPGLKELAEAMLGQRSQDFKKMLKAYGAEDIRGVPWVAQRYYGSNDAKWTLEVFYKLLPHLAKISNGDNIYKRELALIPLTIDMEKGWRIDLRRVREHWHTFGSWEAWLAAGIKDAFGLDLYDCTNDELRELIYADTVPKVRTKTGKASLGKADLADLDTSLSRALMAWKRMVKVRTGFLEPWLELAMPIGEGDTGWIYPTWRPFGTYSGRYSGSNPNMMQVPEVLRDCFLADNDDHVLVDGDYGQLELRIMAWLSGEEKMIDALNDPDRNLHKETVEMIGLTGDDAYTNAKRFNFGVAYGGGETYLSRQTGAPIAAIRPQIEAHKRALPKLWAWRDRWVRVCKRTGRSVTALSHLPRLLPDLYSPDGGRRGEAERQAINHPVQGTGADLIKDLALDAYSCRGHEGVRLIGQVHDELIYSVPVVIAREFAADLKRRAEIDALSPVKIIFEPHIGHNWLEAKRGEEGEFWERITGR